jgi:hypothetical protein
MNQILLEFLILKMIISIFYKDVKIVEDIHAIVQF